jgi:hypothetical protein
MVNSDWSTCMPNALTNSVITALDTADTTPTTTTGRNAATGLR